jgi:putative cardiolipin synthase
VLIALSLGACGGLPKDGDRTVSTAMTDNGRTTLAAAVRLALADAAQRSLDVQYFIWKDMTGKVLLQHLLRAADRGVRVRLLLDDLGTAPSTRSCWPSIVIQTSVRMFNPVVLRSPRLLGWPTDE